MCLKLLYINITYICCKVCLGKDLKGSKTERKDLFYMLEKVVDRWLTGNWVSCILVEAGLGGSKHCPPTSSTKKHWIRLAICICQLLNKYRDDWSPVTGGQQPTLATGPVFHRCSSNCCLAHLAQELGSSSSRTLLTGLGSCSCVSSHGLSSPRCHQRPPEAVSVQCRE